MPDDEPRSQREALGDLAAALSSRTHPVPPARVTGIPWPVLRAVGLAVPMMREVVAIRHQWDEDFVSDATATTETFGLSATPWGEVVRATVAGAPATA